MHKCTEAREQKILSRLLLPGDGCETLPDAEELPGNDVPVRLVVPLRVASPVVGPAHPGDGAGGAALVGRSRRLYDVARRQNDPADVVPSVAVVFGWRGNFVDRRPSTRSRVVPPVSVSFIRF